MPVMKFEKSNDVRIFEIFDYLPSQISYLFKQNDADFSP